MSDERPLQPAALALLVAERSRPEIAGASADRIFARLTGTIAGAAAVAGSALGASAPDVTDVARGAASSIATSKIAGIVLAAFTAGIGVGAVAHSQLAASPPASAPVAPGTSITAAPTSAPSASPAPMTATIADLPSAASATSSAVAVSPRRAAARTAARDAVLARERAWIDQARTALTRGSAADALVALDGHAREFPNGRMAEEREALAIHALAVTGRTDEAAARARSFRARWSSSVFSPVVDLAVPPRSAE